MSVGNGSLSVTAILEKKQREKLGVIVTETKKVLSNSNSVYL